MYQGVWTLCYQFSQCRDSGILNVGRCVVDNEQGHQAVTELWLSWTFRSEQVQDGEALSITGNHIAEQCGQEEADTHFCIISENSYQFGKVVSHGDAGVVQVDKSSFELEQFVIIPVNQTGGRKIVVYFIAQANNAIIVYRVPFGVKYSIAERIESFALPP